VVGTGASKSFAMRPDRLQVGIDLGAVDVGFFELQGLRPIAGRLFSTAYGEDVRLARLGAGPQDQPSVVLNETAVRRLGFRNAEDAVGRTVNWVRWFPPTPPAGGLASLFRPSQVIGVVPDFTLKSIREPIAATIYFVPPRGRFMLIKLSGRQIPETLAGIDRIWRATGHELPLATMFESQAVQDLYRDVIVQGLAIGICAGLAILLACVGLFALAAFTTERRTKEIGVRKAVGANSLDILGLLVWQFTQPVLWANLIAWPLAFWAMDHWLRGFAYRVDLPAWLFVAASGAAVLIAWLTVCAHAWRAARREPATALRYE
jgi:putative ABC transport system permease protein